MLVALGKLEKQGLRGTAVSLREKGFVSSGWMNITEWDRLTEAVRALMSSPKAKFLPGFD